MQRARRMLREIDVENRACKRGSARKRQMSLRCDASSMLWQR